MIFRWSAWGGNLSKNIELLCYSINSFKKQFGRNHQYLIYTDSPDFISSNVSSDVDVREFPTDRHSLFCIRSKATWLKWCPSPRLDIDQIEFFVDSDVFLLKRPNEIDLALCNPQIKFIILDEYLGRPFQHGAMRKKATMDTPFVNAGLFIQKAGQDISHDLIKEFEWWQENVEHDEQTHHDEQGALAIALTKYFVKNELFILPKNKYVIVSKTSNSDLKNLDNITLFHATYPDHPAFYKFKHILDQILDT